MKAVQTRCPQRALQVLSERRLASTTRSNARFEARRKDRQCRRLGGGEQGGTGAGERQLFGIINSDDRFRAASSGDRLPRSHAVLGVQGHRSFRPTPKAGAQRQGAAAGLGPSAGAPRSSASVISGCDCPRGRRATKNSYA